MKTNLLYLSALPFAAVGCQGGDVPQTTERPNILLVFVDDMGYADVGFNGSKYYETPSIDSLANQSVIFENSYAYPLSAPSRVALSSGQQSFRTGVYNVPKGELDLPKESIFSRWTVSKSIPFYSEQLKDVGYKSVHIGKWHMVGPNPKEELALEYPFKHPIRIINPTDTTIFTHAKSSALCQSYYPEGRGFEKNVGGFFIGEPIFRLIKSKDDPKPYRAPFDNPFLAPKPTDEWLTDRLTDEAIEFMDSHDDEPFFVNLCYYGIHRPLVARSEELYNKYINKEGDERLGQGVGDEHKREEDATYATMIESIDDNFARLMHYLKMSGKDKNTIVIFSSDNGYAAGGNNLLRGHKRQIYEGGVRVPTFVHYPDSRYAPHRVQAPISVLDFFPSIISMAGIDNYNGQLDGDSFVDMMDGNDSKYLDRPIFWQISSVNPEQRACTAMRKGRYKVIQYLKSGEIEIYDLNQDPKESHNIVNEQPEIAKKLIKELYDWRESNNVPLPPNSKI